jgi:hypothetical protein
MSVNAAIFPAAGYPSQAVPFCDKRFKQVRIIAGDTARMCAALFYKVIAIVSAVFSATVSHRYHCLSKLELRRVKNLVLMGFGKEIVDFSSNSFTQIKEPLSKGETETDALKRLYGTDAVDQFFELWPETDLTKGLFRHEVGDGCCFGMSLDFISAYLHHIQLGKGPLQAAKEIAPRFANGPSDGAELCQTFYEAAYNTEMLPRYEEKMKNGVDAAKIKRELEAQLGQDDAYQDLCEKAARAFGLVTKQSLNYTIDPQNPEAFFAFVAALPVGAYQFSIVGFSGDDFRCAGHVIAFIKTGEKTDFIFDSNFATLATDQSAMRLREAAKRYGTGTCSVFFTPCDKG